VGAALPQLGWARQEPDQLTVRVSHLAARLPGEPTVYFPGRAGLVAIPHWNFHARTGHVERDTTDVARSGAVLLRHHEGRSD
jgi:hypothetical protein